MGGGGKKRKSRPLYQNQPEVYGKVKWMATSERVNLFSEGGMIFFKVPISVWTKKKKH